MRCPLCDEVLPPFGRSPTDPKSPCKTEDDYTLLRHLKDHCGDAMKWRFCACGFAASPKRGSKFNQCSYLVAEHLAKLTPEQHQQHVVLYQMGARFHD